MRRMILGTSLAVALLLGACGSLIPQSATPTAAPSATSAATATTEKKATATPEEEATPEDEPTSEDEATPTRRRPSATPEDELPTEESSDGTLAPVVIGDLTDYTHPSGIFTLSYPENWSVKNSNEDNLLRTTFTDEKENAAVIVAIFKAETETDEDTLTSALQKDIENAFGSETDFELSEPQTQNDGSIRIQFVYKVTVQGTQAEMLGNSFIQRNGDNVSLLYVLVPRAQFDDLREPINDIINSYKVDETVNP